MLFFPLMRKEKKVNEVIKQTHLGGAYCILYASGPRIWAFPFDPKHTPFRSQACFFFYPICGLKFSICYLS